MYPALGMGIHFYASYTLMIWGTLGLLLSILFYKFEKLYKYRIITEVILIGALILYYQM
jgi:hypothetical protein